MKKIGYVLGIIGFGFLFFLCGIRDFSGPFLENGSIIVTVALVAIACLTFSAYFIYEAEERKKADYRAMIEGRKSSLLRQCRRIEALKR